MKSALITTVALAVLGILDVALRAFYLGPEAGLKASVNDPGKDLFHILLLPTLVFLLFAVPLTSTDLAGGPLRVRSLRAILVVLLFAVTVQVMSETKRAFFEKNSTPEDLSDRTMRESYMKARQGLMLLRAGVIRQPPITAEEGTNIGHQYGIMDFIKIGTNGLITLTSEQARDAAYATSRDLTGPDSGWIGYFRMASMRRHVATALHFAGVCAVAWLFFAICYASMPVGRPSTHERDFLLLMVAVFSTWLPLRFYSEWYHQFYSDKIDYAPLRIGALLAIVSTVVVFSRSSKTIFTSIAPGAVALASAVFALVFQNKGDVFAPIAIAYRDAGWDEILVIHIIVTVAWVAIGTHVFRNVRHGFFSATGNQNAQPGAEPNASKAMGSDLNGP